MFYYRVYPQRWWILVTVVLLNLANYSHWVSFPSVAKTAAKHYDQTGETMDLIPTVSYGLGVPCCLLATYIVERWGLRAGLHIGGILTGIGKYNGFEFLSYTFLFYNSEFMIVKLRLNLPLV